MIDCQDIVSCAFGCRASPPGAWQPKRQQESHPAKTGLDIIRAPQYSDGMPTETKPKRAGRPQVEDEPLVQINIRLTRSQLEWLDGEAEAQGRIGRNAVVRRLISAAKTPKTSEKQSPETVPITKM